MKKEKVIFWITTIIIFLFEGVIPVLTSHTEMAREGITHLGYPIYFGVLLTIFKVLGSLVLVIPQVPKRVKEWAYAGFGFDFIFAFASIWIVDGAGVLLLMPALFFVVLVFSYSSFEKISSKKV